MSPTAASDAQALTGRGERGGEGKEGVGADLFIFFKVRWRVRERDKVLKTHACRRTSQPGKHEPSDGQRAGGELSVTLFL